MASAGLPRSSTHPKWYRSRSYNIPWRSENAARKSASTLARYESYVEIVVISILSDRGGLFQPDRVADR